MNIRKSVDYSMMYAAIDVLMQSKLEQTKLFCEIGKVIDERPEKGAAVAAAEYINAAFPDRSGFSPRSLRRMRDFYRAYKNDPALMKMAMGISWSLNAVIIETCEDHDTRKWYVMACLKYGWSKQELFVQIKDNAHENTELILNETSDQDIVQNACFDRDWGCALLNAHNRIAVKATSFAERLRLPNKGAVYDCVMNMPHFLEIDVFKESTMFELFSWKLFRKNAGCLKAAEKGMGVRIPLPKLEIFADRSCQFSRLYLSAGCSG